MSLITEYNQLRARLEALENNQALKNELDFQDKLVDLLNQYKISPAKAIEVLRSQTPAATSKKVPTNSPKTYKNPHTGETATVVTMLAKPVVEWAKEHGKEEVKKWVIAA